MSGGGGARNWPMPGKLSCPACGATNALGSRFCERCGTRLPQRPGVQVRFDRPAELPEAAPPPASSDTAFTIQRRPAEETPDDAAPTPIPPGASPAAAVPAPGATVVIRP